MGDPYYEDGSIRNIAPTMNFKVNPTAAHPIAGCYLSQSPPCPPLTAVRKFRIRLDAGSRHSVPPWGRVLLDPAYPDRPFLAPLRLRVRTQLPLLLWRSWRPWREAEVRTPDEKGSGTCGARPLLHPLGRSRIHCSPAYPDKQLPFLVSSWLCVRHGLSHGEHGVSRSFSTPCFSVHSVAGLCSSWLSWRLGG